MCAACVELIEDAPTLFFVLFYVEQKFIRDLIKYRFEEKDYDRACAHVFVRMTSVCL